MIENPQDNNKSKETCCKDTGWTRLGRLSEESN